MCHSPDFQLDIQSHEPTDARIARCMMPACKCARKAGQSLFALAICILDVAVIQRAKSAASLAAWCQSPYLRCNIIIIILIIPRQSVIRASLNRTGSQCSHCRHDLRSEPLQHEQQ